MKKFVTLYLALALGAPLSAETLQILRCSEDGIPGQSQDEPQLMGFSISADGRYVCGAIEQAAGFFTADCLTGEVKWKVGGDAGSELRDVDNNGLAIGFNDNEGLLFSFDSGEVSTIKAPAGFRYVLGESLSNDGSVMVGSFVGQSFITEAAFSVDAQPWRNLPVPSDEELGNLKPYCNNGMSAAKYVSADGKVIVGYMGSFRFPTVWTMDAQGEYVSDFFPSRFVKAVEADRNDPVKELYGLTALYTCMSNNGKYVATIGLVANDENTDTRVVPIVYNTEDKTLKVYREIQEIDELELGLYPSAIADDGTFIGTVSTRADPAGNFGAFIMKSGQEQAEWFVDAFPVFAEKLGESDFLGQNIPTDISADGKHILGYAFYSDDFDISSPAPAYFLTYVISLDTSGVDQMDSAVHSVPETIFSVDGRKLGRMAKGLNIVRNSDGTVSKVLKK
ncbi:MAG: hypothetical protein K2H22_06480 [Muribaculaceae bacterium]|nr:hypothetical protein [Muribaculaceae bacterium]